MLLAALVASLAHAPARAAATDSEVVGTRRAVRLEVLGPADEASQLSSSLSELFGRIAVELEASPTDADANRSDAAGGAAVVAEVDLREPGVALVRLAWGSAPFGEPRVVPQRDSRAVLLEEAALVVYAGSETLFNEAFASTPPPLPPPLVVPTAPTLDPSSPPPPPRQPRADRSPSHERSAQRATPWLMEGAMLVGARAYARNASTVTGFALGARGQLGEGRWSPGAWLLGEYHFPFSGRQRGVELATSVWSARIEPSLELVRHGAFTLELGAGGGADIFVLAPVSSSPGVLPGPHRSDASLLLSALLAGSLRTSGASRVVLAATLDYDLEPRRYLVAQGGQSWVILEPWKVRPALALGFLFEIAGGGRQP